MLPTNPTNEYIKLFSISFYLICREIFVIPTNSSSKKMIHWHIQKLQSHIIPKLLIFCFVDYLEYIDSVDNWNSFVGKREARAKGGGSGNISFACSRRIASGVHSLGPASGMVHFHYSLSLYRKPQNFIFSLPSLSSHPKLLTRQKKKKSSVHLILN